MTTNLRMMNTDDLHTLNEHARKHHFNRTLDLDRITVDPDGVHMLVLMLFGHNMDTPGLPLHHRCRVLIKTVDDDEPEIAYLDVLATDWDALPIPEFTNE